MTEPHLSTKIGIDAEELAGHRFPYQEDISLVEDVDPTRSRRARTSTGWRTSRLRRTEAAVFDRYSNSFLKIYFEIPAGREDEIARKVLMKHLIEGNSYGIQLKARHAKFPQPELGPWVEGSETVGTDWKPAVLEGWERPAGH